MMAVRVLGAPQIYGCRASGNLGTSGAFSLSGPVACLKVTPSKEAKTRIQREARDMDGWLRLEAIHCQATQSVLSYTCSQEGHARAVKF